MTRKKTEFDEESEEVIYISRTKLKHEMEDLQRLGIRLAQLSFEQLNTLDLPEDLKASIQSLKRIKPGNHGALKRERQHIGAVMRHVDPEPIEAFFKRIDQQDADQIRICKLAEKWRDTLIAGDDKLLTEIVETFPRCDLKRLSQLTRGARQEITNQGHIATNGRSLFRLLKQLLETEKTKD